MSVIIVNRVIFVSSEAMIASDTWHIAVRVVVFVGVIFSLGVASAAVMIVNDAIIVNDSHLHRCRVLLQQKKLIFSLLRQTSKQYNRIGKHLLLINCKIISWAATRPTFSKIALAARCLGIVTM